MLKPWLYLIIISGIVWVALSGFSGIAGGAETRGSLAAPEVLASHDDSKSASDQNKYRKTDAESPRIYWNKGLHLENSKKNISVKIGGKFAVDGGEISADKDLEAAFPDLAGGDIRLRKLELGLSGSLYGSVKFKFQVDLDHPSEIKDSWLDFSGIPVIGHIRLGHMKEPVSLEEQIGFNNSTFMEKSLPTEAFVPGRNLGVLLHDTAAHERLTWAVGGFWETGTFENLENPADRIEDAKGFNATTRITALPWWAEDGRSLLHMGMSFTHQFRGSTKDDSTLQFRARPESHLTSDRLVDTGEFPADSVNLINPELALSSGPFSMHAESFHAFVDGDTGDAGRFFGYYLYGSYFITGEHRNYNRAGGKYSGLAPAHDVRFDRGGWGAWELGFRYSYIDLNDGEINGGKERNYSGCINWYINPQARFMLNVIRADVKDRETPPAVHKGQTNIFQVRFQLAF